MPGEMCRCSDSNICFDFGPGISVRISAFFVTVSWTGMFPCLSMDELCDMAARLRPDGSETRPVVDINNRHAPVLSDDRIAAVDGETERLRRGARELVKPLLVELRVIDSVQIVPVEKLGLVDGIKFDGVPVEVFLQNR